VSNLQLAKGAGGALITAGRDKGKTFRAEGETGRIDPGILLQPLKSTTKPKDMKAQQDYDG